MTLTWTLDLPAEVESPRRARRAVTDWVGSPALTGDLVLCISELVTNAVLHARSSVRLDLMKNGAAVRVEVHDNDPTIPVRRDPAPEAPTGRGLLLLDRLATAWGVDAQGTGKVVWFTMELGQDPG